MKFTDLTPPQVVIVRTGLKWALVAAVVLGLVYYGYRWKAEKVEHAQDKATITQQAQTAQATAGIADDAAAATAQGAETERAIGAIAATSTRHQETLSHASPTYRDWRAARVPDQLRERARARRQARDRLAGAGPGSPGADPGTPAPGQ